VYHPFTVRQVSLEDVVGSDAVFLHID
jgi:hypothetical protein